MGDETGVHLSMCLYVPKYPSKQNNKEGVAFEICLRIVIVVFTGMRGRIPVSILCTNCISTQPGVCCEAGGQWWHKAVVPMVSALLR